MIWPSLMDKVTLVLVFWALGGSQACEQAEWKVTPIQDIEDLQVMREDGLSDYSNFFIDRPNQQIIIGIENHLFRLDIENLEVKQKVAWEVVPAAVKTCLAKGRKEEQCNNFIRVLLPYQDRFLACGTGAFIPLCSWRKLLDLDIVDEMTGRALCPYDPLHNTTSLMTKEGDVYTAMAMDYQSKDYAVVRPHSNSRLVPLRSMDHSNWLSDPNFVAAFDVGLYVYFFFREIAQEDSINKNVFSRVLRIAKDDTGGQNIMKNFWTTFIKARLNCSIPGHSPFYFNEIQSAYYLEEEGVFYAVFTTPRNSIHGSAICIYNQTDVEKAFDSNYLYQENSRSAWVQEENVYKNTYTAERATLDAQRYQLMSEAIQPISARPIYSDMLGGTVLTEISIDTVSGLHGAVYQVIFTGTETGTVRKMVVPPGGTQTCLVEEIVLFPEGDQAVIKKLHVDTKKGLLMVGTDVKLFRFPLERCKTFKTNRSCLEANDPYCGWNQITRRCAKMPENADPLVWQQDVSRCPLITPVPVDGKYGRWTEWSSCKQMTDNSATALCTCRSRQCDSPAPSCGGKLCETRQGIQVTNCTVHGGWSSWSAWTNCQATCGTGVRIRDRTCTNPVPRHGGLMCLGQPNQLDICDSGPCPGLWKPWGSWGPCDQQCGPGGQQSRERQCSNNNCQGESQQQRPCNTEKPCSHQLNLNAEVPLKDSTSVTSVDGKWSRWSDWTPCSATCDGGTQTRSRECSSPPPSGRGQPCPGASAQQRACNYQPCLGNQLWSCWSDWSECSELCVKQRVRTCPGGKTTECDREEIQQQPCDSDACTGESGWKEWSEWSECDATGVKGRTRVCGWEKPPESLCQGDNIQFESCNASSLSSTAIKSSLENEKPSNSYMYIIIAAISGGLTCSVLTVLAISICFKPKRRHRHRTDSNSSYVSNASNSGINVFASYNANNNSYETAFSPSPRQYNDTRKESLPQTNGKKKINSSRKKSQSDLDAPYMGTL